MKRIWNRPIASTHPDGSTGKINDRWLDGGWPEILTDIPEGVDRCIWFPFGCLPEDPLPFITVTDGRRKKEPRLANLIQTYRLFMITPSVKTMAYIGHPRAGMSRDISTRNVFPMKGSQFVLDKCAALGEEWRSDFLRLQDWSGFPLVLEGWPQRNSRWLDFPCYFMLKSLPHPGPNGMTLDEIEEAPFPEKYCLIRSNGDLPDAQSREHWENEILSRGINLITRW